MVETSIYCPQCGYDLRALTSERCPECGLELSQARVVRSQIPWEQKRQWGRIGAFVRTVYLATIHPGTLALNAAMPVHYDAANRFRKTVTWFGLLPIAAIYLYVYLCAIQPFPRIVWPTQLFNAPFTSAVFGRNLIVPWLVDLGAFILTCLLIRRGLLAMSSTYALFSRSRHRDVVHQNRAVSLSLYAASPWVLFPIVIMIPVVAVLWKISSPPPISLPVWNDLLTPTIIGCTAPLVVWMFLLLRSGWVLLRRTAGRSTTYCAIATPVVLLLWLIQAAVFMVALPAIAFYVAFIITASIV